MNISFAKNFKYAVVGPLQGELCSGTPLVCQKATYDTMSSDIIVANSSKKYHSKSSTAHCLKDDDKNWVKRPFRYGAFKWKDEVVCSDRVCLNQKDKGSCLPALEFILSKNMVMAAQMSGYNDVEAVLGLAPPVTGSSFISQFKKAANLDKAIVAIDFDE